VKLKFNQHYFVRAIALLGIEILIAKFANDAIIRPYIGDLLVVILIYCLIKSFVDASVYRTALGVLLFSYSVEVFQYFQIVNLLELQDSRIARIVIGTCFSWMDLLAYTSGIILVLYLEQRTKMVALND